MGKLNREFIDLITHDRNIVLKTYRRSIAYGTNLSSEESEQHGLRPSDVDTHAIVVPPKRYVLSYGYVFSSHRFETVYLGESCVYSLHRFIKLASECNPSVLEMLFVSPEHIIKEAEVGRKLIAHRELFVCARAKDSFGGFARRQLIKMETDGRKELIERFGYDVKFAYHAVRILQMEVELLSAGTMSVYRPN